jgi:hypothetical protein
MNETLLAEPHTIEMPKERVYDISSLGEGLALKMRKAHELTNRNAEAFLELADFPGDRKLQEPHVVFLARQMTAGTFRWEQVSLITCFWEGTEYRMNGQHTAWARLTSKLPDSHRTPVQLLKYEAKTEQDMRQLYASIDRGKPRNMGNVVISYLAGREEFPDYTKSLLKKLCQGLALWKWESDEQRSLHTGDERAYLMLTEHHKLALSVGNFLKTSETADSKHMNRAPSTAAMFATFHKAPQIAAEFWRVVRDGVGIDRKEDPRHALRNYLMTTALAATSRAGPDVRIVTQEEMYRGCLLAWNQYRANKPLRQIRSHKIDSRPEVR